MAPIPPMRPTETGSADAEPAAVLRGSSPVRTAAAIAAAAAVFLAVVVLAGVGRLDSSVPSFLEESLGPEKAEAPMERTPATGVGVRINDQGYTVSHWGVSVSVASEDVGGSDWRRHVHGVTRETEFGTETIVVNGRKTEEFLTVTERQGTKAWRWELASRLHPRLGRDGAVTFLDPTRHRVTSIAIEPVRILDAEGKDVTPDGLRWGLEEGSSGWVLTLELDDKDLPLPYVIDPAVTHRAATTATTTGATSLAVNVPAGVQPNDLLVAHIAGVGNVAINTPSGWTAAGGTNNGSFIRQATYYKVAGSSEPASYTWTWTGTQPAAGGMSAYYGVKSSAPLGVVGTATTANNTTTVTAASITTAANDALVLAFFSSNTNSTYSTATGMSERYEIGTTGAVSVASDDMTQVAAGATGNKSSTAGTSGRVVGHQVSFNVDDVSPSGSVTDPGSPLAGTVTLNGTGADTDSAVAGVLFQRSPANAGTWTDIGTADTTSPYTASFNTTGVADGLYDLRVVVTDAAGNVFNSTVVEDRLVDNTAPTSTTTFPASAASYNTAGWNAGCGTIGVCGTYSDGAGSGVAQVQISIRQGTGNYWSAGSFSSASEVWNTTTIAAGNWSYAFAAASFPTNGGYTIRVRATDAATNVETPNSRSFTIDTDEPETTIDSSPANPTASTSAAFTFSSDEGGSTFECRTDGGAWGACTSPANYTSLSDGSHTFEARATDAAGNQDSSAASYTWLVDTTAPSSTTTFPAASGEYNATGWAAGCATAGLCGTYSDGAGSGVAQVQISIRQGAGNYWNGSAFSSGSEAWNTATLAGGDWSYAFAAGSFPADGSYTMHVRATDDAGNVEGGATRTFTYDTTAPQTTIDTSPTDPTAADDADFDFSADESGSTFECRLDGGAWSPCTSPKSYTALADGNHTFQVRATDLAGNVDGTPASHTWLVDTTAPNSTTAFPAAAGEYNAAGWNAGCATSGICGTYGDGAGSGVDHVQVSVQRDSTGLYWNGASFSAGAEVLLGTSLAGGDWTRAFPASNLPADGDYTVRVFATDEVGNAETPSSRTFTFDATDPTGALTAPADGAVLRGSSITVSSDSADAGSGVDQAEFQHRPAGGGPWTTIDTDSNAPYSASWDTTPLADGDHDLRVTTTDHAGNTSTSPLRTVTVDNTDPSAATLDALPGAIRNGQELTGSGADATSGVDSLTYLYCAGASCTPSTPIGSSTTGPEYSVTWTGQPADGGVRVLVRVTDRAGNTLDSAIQDVEVDNTSPTGSLTAPADAAVLGDSSVTVSSDSADAGSGVDQAEFQHRPAGGGPWTTIDTDSTAPYSASWDTTPLADGDHDLRVTTTDHAGNTSTSPLRTVTVDNTAPSAPVVTLSESSPFAHVSGSEIFVNTDESGMYDVQATSSDATSGIDKIRFPGPADDSTSPYQASYGFGDLSGGQTVTAYNGVDLMASSPFTVTPDTAEPAGGSVDYPNGYDVDGEVTITVDAGTDALSGVAPASAVLERRTAPLSDGDCDPFAGGWSAVGSPDTVASGLCAQYRYRVSDRVGNEAVYASGHVVQVDLVNPAAPVLTLDESSPNAHVVGTKIFVNTNESGSYDLEAAASDAVSGVDKVAFPGGVDDTSAPYTATYDFDDLLGVETVTAHDRAGNTASSDFEVTEDISAPSTTDDTASIGSAWQTAPVTVTLTPTDARSGVATTYYTTDGSVPTTSSDEGTSIDLTADGVYVIRYFSVDNVGNAEPVRTAFATIRMDQTDPGAPSISLSESGPYAHVSGGEIFVNTNETGTYGVSASSSDAGSGIDKVVFPGGVEDSTSPYSTSYDLDDLSGSQAVTVHDGAGNTSSDTFTVTPDTTAPAGGSVDYPDGYDADGTVTITADAGTDALSGLAAGSGVLERRTTALTGDACGPFVGGWSAVTSPDTVPDSTCARYRYRVSDRVGNEAIYTLPTSTVKVDLTAPETTIDVAPGDPSSDASPTFDFSASEGGSTFECRLDGGAWTACTSPRSYASLADGSHTFQVRATDAGGNVDGSPASHTWVINTGAPNTSLDAVPADPSNDDAPSFEFSATEPGSTFECRLDGGAWAACSSPETVGLLADGGHTFQVRATNAAGNVDGSPASHSWTVDTVAPESSFGVVPADPTNDTTPTFEFSASEGGSSFQCRLDGGAWGPCSSPATVGPLADGSHTFDVRATDPAGNQETTPEPYTWVVDAGAPSVSITLPSGFVNASDADPYIVRATSPDGDVASVELFRCSDASADCSGGSWVSLGTVATPPYEASWPLDADGNRALRAVATDAAANTGSDVVNVTIDRTVPATTIDSAPSDPNASTSASFAFSSSEGGATFECRLDGGAWGACTSPQGYTGLTEGNHGFHVRATDAAGNVDPTPATFGWTVDTVAPETTIDAAPGDPSSDASPTFDFSASEGGSTFECRLDGGAWGACSSPQAYSGLADGSHTFQVRATDAAGNVDGTPATYTWTIDATAPGGGLADPGQFLRGTVALTASPSDTGAGVQTVDFQVSPADAGSWTSIGVDTSDPYALDWDTTALADGAYDLRIVVTDNAGNSSPSAVVEDRIVDNTAPGATMNDPGPYLRGTVSLGANATDAGSGVATVVFERSPAGAGSWTPVAASWNTTSVADGLYDLRVRVSDNAGNSTTSAPVSNRRVDNTKPSLTSSVPADGTTIASASGLAISASEDVSGIVGAQIDGAAAPAATVAGNTVTYAQTFSPGPHLLAGELEDLAGNRQPIRIHFTTWSGTTTDYPYVEKNSETATPMSLRSASDTTTVTVPAGAWTGAPAGDWLVLRLDPQPASGAAGGFQPASEALDVTAYWALAGSAVTSFSLPLQIEVDNTQAHVIPAVLESGAWRPIAQAPGGSLPASWNDGFVYDGSNVRILTRHLSLFTLLEDVQPPTKPGGFKGTVTRSTFGLSWNAAADNSGLVSAYRIYANGAVVKTVGGSSRSTPMGRFTLTDRRAFQVAAVDEAGNVGPKSGSLKVVPKLAKLTLASAKKALTNRGFKVGKVTYKASATVAKGKVIAGAASGLKPAGSKIGLTVSKGKAPARRPSTPATPAAPPTTPSTGSTTTAPPVTTPTTPVPTTRVEESVEPEHARVIPFVGPRIGSVSDLRQELGFGILAAAFSIAFTAGLRARRPSTSADPDPEQMLLWDQRLLQAIRRFLRLSS